LSRLTLTASWLAGGRSGECGTSYSILRRIKSPARRTGRLPDPRQIPTRENRASLAPGGLIVVELLPMKGRIRFVFRFGFQGFAHSFSEGRKLFYILEVFSCMLEGIVVKLNKSWCGKSDGSSYFPGIELGEFSRGTVV
jgi:hypothetical protein